MLEKARVELPVERGLGFLVAAGVVGAAVVGDIVVTLGAEVVGHGGIRATGGAVAAPGEGAVVVDHHAAAGRAETGFPGIVEAVLEQPVEVQRADAHRVRPALVREHVLWRNVARHAGAAEQLIARHRVLLAVLVLGVELQQGVGADVPVQRQRGEIALAVGMVDIGADVFVGQVDAHAHLLFGTEPAADVCGQVAFTLFVGGHRDRAHIFRALAHVVDQPAGLGDAALQAGQALEHFDLLLVFQGDVLFAGDRAAVDLVAARRVEGEAANHEVLVVADRGVAVADRGVVFQYFAEQARLLVLQAGFGDHRDGRRRVQQRRVIETGHGGVFRLVVGGCLAEDGDGVQGRILGLHGRGGEGDAQGEQGVAIGCSHVESAPKV